MLTKKLIVALLFGLLTTQAFAETYTYIGPAFQANEIDPGSRYSVGDRITGSLTTTAPIPPNSVDFDITPILSSFSYTDGIQTITSASASSFAAIVSTDASGNIIEYPAMSACTSSANSVGDEVGCLSFARFADEAAIFACQAVANGLCTDFGATTDYYASNNTEAGTWTLTTAPAASASAIPALPVYGLVLTMLGLVVIAARRLRATVRHT